ncbi:D-malate degradation protein R [Achromobacter denitrificans]|uniref:LysR family transcriptional regulator n=1 Tax=Achromobacter denitrificans TaxID=32002 RepID=UPI0007884B0A|nr:LysR family transcriptional regulator [Achromobacter denitrificans]OLU10361.1 transcriptional regulator [Achromobacter denitrificans]QKH43398.1 LysR family transcriptional regulator [Achromobacter denitrificans]QKH49461.1 LysR family transcriptional regulator [Achromobacter denitrificans]CAB3654600.1 HTH-type transcriptional regulator DmlR [Achromobacter denitrificans]SUU13683.1 D-malate degradation protein R [Achromobacter denitrificans]
MDHLTALKVFRQVVEQGGFAAASRHMGLSPAAVSKNVAELEAHLAARLLNRTTRRMSLTEAGTRYYEQVCRILDDLREAEMSLGPMQQAPTGTLRVSAPMSLSLTRLSAAVPRFLERYPGLSLDLNLEDRRVDIVKEGYDLAIRGSDKLEDSSLVARRLMTLEHVLCAAPAYFRRHGVPAEPAALRGMECVRFTLSGHADEWILQREGQVQRVPARGRYKVSSSLAVCDALRAGFGVSLVPRAYVQRDLDSGALQAALSDWTPVETYVYAVYPSRRHMVAKVRAFVDFLLEELGPPRA